MALYEIEVNGQLYEVEAADESALQEAAAKLKNRAALKPATSPPPVGNPTIGPSLREESLEEVGGDPNIYEKVGLNVEGESDGERVVDFLTKMLGVAAAPGAIGAMPAVLGATTGAELLAGAKAIGVPAAKALTGAALGEAGGRYVGAPKGAGALVGGLAGPMTGNPIAAARSLLTGQTASPGARPAPTAADMAPRISFRDFVDRLVAGFKSGYQQPTDEVAAAVTAETAAPTTPPIDMSRLLGGKKLFGGDPLPVPGMAPRTQPSAPPTEMSIPRPRVPLYDRAPVNPFDEIVARLNQPAPPPLPAPAPKPGIKPPAIEDGKWVDDIQVSEGIPRPRVPLFEKNDAGKFKLSEPKTEAPRTAAPKKEGIKPPKIEPTGEAAKPVRKPAAPRTKKATTEEPTAVGSAERKKLATILKSKEGMTAPEVTAATNAEGSLAKADAVAASAKKLRTQMLAEPEGSAKIKGLQDRIAALEKEQQSLEHEVTRYLAQQQTRAHLPGIRR